MYCITTSGVQALDRWSDAETEDAQELSEIHVRIIDCVYGEGVQSIREIVDFVHRAEHFTFLDEKHIVSALADLLIKGYVVRR